MKRGRDASAGKGLWRTKVQRILDDIKSGQFRQSYLLYGEEAYLRKQYRDKLKNAMAAPDDTMNYRYFEGKGLHIGEVIDLAETMPFLAERRVIVIENSGLFKSGGEQLAAYLEEPAPTVHFVFVEAEVDKRSKMFKLVKEKGTAVEFAVQDAETLKKWTAVMLKKENKKITGHTLDFFLEKTGYDMANIRNELEKLICYTQDREIVTDGDVEAVCSGQVNGRIFDMIGAIADRQQKKALDLYYDLVALKEPPMRILFLIARQFNLLLQVKELKQNGYDSRTVSEKTGLRSFLIGKYAAQAARFRKEELREALEDCVATEEGIKTGKVADFIGTELLIVRYSGLQKPEGQKG